MAELFRLHKLKSTPENPDDYALGITLYPDGRCTVELQTPYEAMSEDLEPDETAAMIEFLTQGKAPAAPKKSFWRDHWRAFLTSLQS